MVRAWSQLGHHFEGIPYGVVVALCVHCESMRNCGCGGEQVVRGPPYNVLCGAGIGLGCLCTYVKVPPPAPTRTHQEPFV